MFEFYHLFSLSIIICLFSRFHNGTLLDRKVYKYEEDLVLRDLKPEQSGQYYCKTSSSTGSVKSSPATLTVIGMFKLGSHIEKQYNISTLPSHKPRCIVKGVMYNLR